jgi:hypothetical protein
MPGEEYLLALGHLPPDTEETSQAGSKTLFSVFFRRRLVLKKLRFITFQATEHGVRSFMKVHTVSYISPWLQYPIMST